MFVQYVKLYEYIEIIILARLMWAVKYSDDSVLRDVEPMLSLAALMILDRSHD